MQLERERPAFMPSPSFEGSSATTATTTATATATEVTDDRPSFASTEGSPNLISAAEEPERPEVEDDEFEFSFMVRDPELGSDFNVADEIFSNGQIRPVYPVFNRDLLFAAGDAEDDEKAIRLPLRRLLIEDREACSRSGSVSSTSSSSADDLEGIAPGSYCVWNPRSVPPSPDRCKKSSSTGSTSRKWRIRDLVVGRSHSDGKEKFLFLAPPEKEKEKRPSPGAGASPSRSAAKGKGTTVVKDGKKKGGKVTEVDMVTAHQLYYVKGSDGGARRSFLPYKIGFFANVNGFSQTHRPF